MPDSLGLAEQEARATASMFDVETEKIHCDHLACLIIATLADSSPTPLTFFGGTVLAHTHLAAARLAAGGRLCGELDLLTTNSWQEAADHVDRAITEVLRSRGQVPAEPSRLVGSLATGATVHAGDGGTLRVRLLASSLPPWPTERCELHRPYSDIPATSMRVPTIDAFVAWKTAAWHEHRMPHDLYDLWALAKVGAITHTATDLYARHEPAGRMPSLDAFLEGPDPDQWERTVGRETRLTVAPDQAAAEVRAAWRCAIDDWRAFTRVSRQVVGEDGDRTDRKERDVDGDQRRTGEASDDPHQEELRARRDDGARR